MRPDQLSDIAATVCECVDWRRPELADTAFAGAYRDGDALAGALGLVRYMRERGKPDLGYSAEYVARLRESAPPGLRERARQTVTRLRGVSFLGGSWADGRETLLCARPEELQLGAGEEDFTAFAGIVADAREQWGTGKQHTAGNIARFLQSVWPLEECPDETLLPLFAFLVVQFGREWAGARTWHEASLGTSGHNWWVAEFGRMWQIGLFFPEFRGFARLRALFPTFFEREMRILIAPDGFTREASVSYHTGTSDLFLDVVRVAQRNGLELSGEFHNRLRAMYDVEWKLMTPDGNHPAFGDCFNLPGYEFDRMPSIAAILGIPQAKYIAECMDPASGLSAERMLLETLHYPSVGEDLWPAYDRVQPLAPTTVDTALVDSGYYVMRQDWTTRSDYAALEAAPKGNLVTSHGHGCIFDLRLYSRGRPILIANGKGPCGSPEPERTWRHESMSHSVAVVDGEQHVPLRSVYRFANVVLPVVDAWVSEPEFAYFSGVHEAYERLEKKVSGSRRKLFYLRGKYWILTDRFTPVSPDDTHTYQQRFQLGVPSRIEEGGRVVTEGEGGNLLFVPVEGVGGEVGCEPIPYPLADHPRPDQLTYTREVRGNALLVTLLVPFEDGNVPDVEVKLSEGVADERVVDPWEVTGLDITIDGERHVYVDQHMQWNLPWRCGGHEGADRLFHSACRTDATSSV